MRSLRLLTAAAALAALTIVPAGADLRGDAWCGGVAPTRTECTTGYHLLALNMAQLLDPQPGYTGMLESRLVWFQGERVLRCYYLNGFKQLECFEGGDWPPAGIPYRHECTSYAYGSFVPGGSGSWRCGTRHTPRLPPWYQP